jgi:hypothetical protein
MRIVDGLFTLANVAIGGIIGALATGRASRLSARADAIDDFNLVRPLWSQNPTRTRRAWTSCRTGTSRCAVSC